MISLRLRQLGCGKGLMIVVLMLCCISDISAGGNMML